MPTSDGPIVLDEALPPAAVDASEVRTCRRSAAEDRSNWDMFPPLHNTCRTLSYHRTVSEVEGTGLLRMCA